MPFPSIVTQGILNVQEGESWLGASIDLSTDNYAAGIVVGRFVYVDPTENYMLKTLDGTANATVATLAGVLLRSPVNPVELGATDNYLSGFGGSDLNITYRRQGMVSVALAAGAATPTPFAPVYAINSTTGTDSGNVTPTAGTNLLTTAEFIKQIQPGIWLIRIK
jgi:hypothetical protein